MAVLSSSFASAIRGGTIESGVDYRAGKGRDRKVEPGATFARRIWSETEGDQAGEGTWIQAQNISGWPETNRSGTESQVGQDSSREEIKAAFIPTRRLRREPYRLHSPGQLV
jgi:hypothetical protein